MASATSGASIWDFYEPPVHEQPEQDESKPRTLLLPHPEAAEHHLTRTGSALSSRSSSSARARSRTTSERMPRSSRDETDSHYYPSSRAARRNTSDRSAYPEGLAKRRNSTQGDKRKDAWTSRRSSVSHSSSNTQQGLVPTRRRAFELGMQPAPDQSRRYDRPPASHQLLTSPSLVSFLSSTTASSGSSGSTVTQTRYATRSQRKALEKSLALGPEDEDDNSCAEDGEEDEEDNEDDDDDDKVQVRRGSIALQPSVVDEEEQTEVEQEEDTVGTGAVETGTKSASAELDHEAYHSDSSSASESPSESSSSGTAATSFTRSSSQSSPELPRKRFPERRVVTDGSSAPSDVQSVSEEEPVQETNHLALARVDAPPPAPSPPRTAQRHRHAIPPLPQYAFQAGPSPYPSHARPMHPGYPPYQPTPQPHWRGAPGQPQSESGADSQRYRQHPPHPQPFPHAPQADSNTFRLRKAQHETLVSAMSASDEALAPIYRSFSGLQHRVMLRLQDELTEMETLLKYYDNSIARSHHSSDEHAMSRSSSSEPHVDPINVHYLRDDLLNRIAAKVGQYEQAVSHFRSLTQKCDAAKPADVERYKSWLAGNSSTCGYEPAMLDHAKDLVDVSAPKAPRVGVSGMLQSIPMARQMLLVPPLALFIMLMVLHTVPFTMSRMVLVVLSSAACWVALRSPYVSHAVSQQDALLCVGLYAGLMSVFALTFGTG